MNRSFDLTIVGGGIIGAMLAWLTYKRHPTWRTLWLDRSLFGYGASAYSAGLITPFGRTAGHRSLAQRSAYLFRELGENVGPLPLRELPAWLVTGTENQTAVSSWFITGTPPRATRADACSLQTLVPELTLPEGDVLLGPFQVQQAWPMELITRIVDLCGHQGQFSIWEGVELAGWHTLEESIQLSFMTGNTLESQRLILATGPWQVHKAPASPAGQIRIKKVAACHLEIPPVQSAPTILLTDYDAFLLPLPEQRRWLFSFPSTLWNVEPGSPRLVLDDEDDRITDTILKLYMPSAAVHRHGGRIFCDGYTEDRVPLVCRMGNSSNVIYAGGCSGSGFRLAPAIAERALDMLEGASASSDSQDAGRA